MRCRMHWRCTWNRADQTEVRISKLHDGTLEKTQGRRERKPRVK